MPAATWTVRNLRRKEGIPACFVGTGFEPAVIQPEWVWLAEYRGKPVAILFAANAHGLLLLLRILATPDAPVNWPMIIFRQVFAEAKARGCIGYYTFLDDSQPAEVKFMRLVIRTNGGLLPASGAWAMNTFLDREES